MSSKFSCFLFLISLLLLIVSCQEDEDSIIDDTALDLYKFPNISNFRPVPENPDNPVTNAGVALGKKLFFDNILSSDFSMSCGSCHKPELSFTDGLATSPGVRGLSGRRSSMALVNLPYYEGLFWDARSPDLIHQAFFPVPDTLEMDLPWEEAIERLNNHAEYPNQFEEVFGTDSITQPQVAKALEQFQKTLLSYNSPYDLFERGEKELTPSQRRGMLIFSSEKGDCFHCHNLAHELIIHPEIAFTNNGMEEVASIFDFKDGGVGEITRNPNHYGQFKIPTLRNLAFTAPYMHDGRFATLDEVIDFYNEGPKRSPTLDLTMEAEAKTRLKEQGHWGLNLSEQEKEDLKNFLLSLSDSSFINNPAFRP